MQDAEEYYRRTLSAKYLPINPDSKTPNVDKAIRLTGLIVDRMRAWESCEITQEDTKSLREVFNEETQFFDEPDSDREFRKAVELDDRSWYYNEPHKPKWYFLTLEIDSELRAVFHNRNESILQNRDANYLIDCVVNLILPTYFIEHGNLFTKWDGNKIVSTNFITFSGDEVDGIEADNTFFRTNFIHALHSWAKKITDYVRMYAPEVFEKHQEQIDFYFRNGKPALSSQEPQPPEPGVKLKWNCQPAVAGFIISELIRAGYIDPPTTNGEMSNAKLAAVCNQIFDIRGKEDKPTTLDYLKNVVDPERNTLSPTKRAKLKLPDLSDLK